MSELRDLYQEVILDHNRQPRNFRAIEAADRNAEGFNPLCGDQCQIFLKLNGDVLEDVSFLGSGCAISKASASLMTAALKGKTQKEAHSLFEKFHHMIVGAPDEGSAADLGKLSAFAGVCEFPARVKCASLPWHTFQAALNEEKTAVTTEAGEEPWNQPPTKP